jgi:hypothetical protein
MALQLVIRQVILLIMLGQIKLSQLHLLKFQPTPTTPTPTPTPTTYDNTSAADFDSTPTGFFATAQTSGETTFTLQPIASAVGQSVRASFGIPFPKGYVTNINSIRILGCKPKRKTNIY